MEFDPYSETFFEDPWETYRWLRDEHPIYHHERLGFYAVSRYDDCMEVHKDAASFSSTRGVTLDQLRSAAFGEAVEGQGLLIMTDPPRHERLRKLVSRAFTPRRIAAWEPVVSRVIGDALDRLDGTTSFDAVVDFSGPFPVEVISEIVGIPPADRQQLRHWTDTTLEREIGNPFPTDAGIEAAIATGEYMRALVADRRRHPADDMLGHLLEAEVEGDDGTVERLDDDAVAGFVVLLIAAGAETVTKLVGNGVMTFAEHPAELARLKADPGLVASAVEEVLRFRAPAQYAGRFCVADWPRHGTTIPAGSP
ncbi:MAG TPA: cytochrome P450, partial [Acidimicrobiales bacterium]